MVILVTGGTVFASRYTAGYFASMGHEVFVLNRGTKPQPENVTPIIADRHSLGDTLRNRHFDAVIDVTAYNADDVNCLLDGLGSFGCCILVSSSAVYPETLPQPFKEDGSIGVNSIWGKYGTDKIAAEQALRSRVPDAYILRPPYLCGPMNNLHREAFVFECAENDLPFFIPKDGKMPLQFFLVSDLAKFIHEIIKNKPKNRIFNVGKSAVRRLSIDDPSLIVLHLCRISIRICPDLRHCVFRPFEKPADQNTLTVCKLQSSSR